jgi:uncharacterized DUF497 family protein
VLNVIWYDNPDDPDSNVEHIHQHGLTKDDVEFVLENPESEATSRETGRPCAFGHTPEGRYIIVVYEQIDDETVYPVTAYEVREP